MSRPVPLHVTLGRLTAASREKLAAEKLALDRVRDAAGNAAREGLSLTTISLGPAPLGGTRAARALQEALRGFTFEWVEGVTRDGQPHYELRLMWMPAPDETV